MKILENRDARSEFANVKDPGVILALNKRVFDSMIDYSKKQSYKLSNKITHLERYSYWEAEAPEEISKLVQDIIFKVRKAQIFAHKKAIVKDTHKNYERAEQELIDFVGEKCRFIAKRITEIIIANKNAMISEP